MCLKKKTSFNLELPVKRMAYTLDRTLDTIPKLLLDHSKKRGYRPANRHKDFGIWQSCSDVAEDVRCLACGLAKKGLWY